MAHCGPVNQRDHREGRASDEYDEDLRADHERADCHEEPVAQHTLEHVEVLSYCRLLRNVNTFSHKPKGVRTYTC